MKKLISTLFLFLSLLACGSKTDNQAITTAIKSDIDSMSPYKMHATGTKQIMYNVYEGLLMPDVKGKLKLAIAKDMKISDDMKTYTFEIRDDVYFHNGDKLKLSDVIFSLNKIKELGIEKSFSNIDDISEKDGKLVIKLNKIDASFIYSLIKPIVDEKTYDNIEKTANGTGPYYISEYLRENKLVFTRNDKYYGKKANIKTINMDILTDEDTSILNLLSGKYNFLFEVSTKRVEDLKDKKIVTHPENMLFIMGINNKRFDKDLRAKLVSALDNKDIISKATANYATELKTKKINIEKNALEGKEFNLKIPSNYKIYIISAQVIKEELENYGAKVNIIPQEFATWLKEVYKDRDYDLTIIGLSGKLDKEDTYKRFVSTYAKNFLNFSNKEYDEIIEKASYTVDTEKRDNLYEKAYDVLIDNFAAGFIMDPALTTVMDKNIQGFSEYTIPYVNYSTLKFGE
ncbi:ABC transporter substrate-binding protein [Oceanivirga miroungae]|uniref:Family 5 extracellular solute-binding protein n=1 Tax=Oceanivirga miroungae TaxID=1130046 RepID=A0A6I8MAQ8_9FUSO|nr:ABC transporter substrate-binding protein [Oceanivirga miroungae]VWL85263.1 family 5 extracellular solute-binding protein [Oceanivirga miroungae]